MNRKRSVLLKRLRKGVRAFRDGFARSRQIQENRRWLLSLDQAHLLALITEPDAGLDKQDLDGLVQITFETYPEGQRDAIITRIATHLHQPLIWPD
jgi:hypothetical protein